MTTGQRNELGIRQRMAHRRTPVPTRPDDSGEPPIPATQNPPAPKPLPYNGAALRIVGSSPTMTTEWSGATKGVSYRNVATITPSPLEGEGAPKGRMRGALSQLRTPSPEVYPLPPAIQGSDI
jgi:hypothetical protein